MTNLESPRKNNDCYFYYYSTCAKGDNCTFRHEPSALGCETMCSFWKEGKCLNVHCNFRHMELRKNRKVIPCYWESQPGGCLKPHCPFMHQNAKQGTADDSIESSKTDSGTESADNTMNEKLSQMSDKNFKTPVDSLVVNFEEESDNESAPTYSPIKPTSNRMVKVKTLEEIKLEKIQAESAAYYSYPDTKPEMIMNEPQSNIAADDLRQRILKRFSSKPTLNNPITKSNNKKLQTALFKSEKKEVKDISEIKIKTLEEIRAERAKKLQDSVNLDVCDSSVTSTCNDEIFTRKRPSSEMNPSPPPAKKKLKLKRNLSPTPPMVSDIKSEIKEEKIDETDELYKRVKVKEEEERNSPVHSDSSKIDEVLLLQDDDDSSNVSLKEEDELLNEIDDLLEDRLNCSN